MSGATPGRYVRCYYREHEGAPLYFEAWVAIGPKFTADPSKAARFATAEDANAVSFWLAPMRTEVLP
jgi:hypothetical protein